MNSAAKAAEHSTLPAASSPATPRMATFHHSFSAYGSCIGMVYTSRQYGCQVQRAYKVHLLFRWPHNTIQHKDTLCQPPICASGVFAFPAQFADKSRLMVLLYILCPDLARTANTQLLTGGPGLWSMALPSNSYRQWLWNM